MLFGTPWQDPSSAARLLSGEGEREREGRSRQSASYDPLISNSNVPVFLFFLRWVGNIARRHPIRQ